ncbi:alpha/beta hydrolase [Lysobacter sp. TAF61]|uniref:alpha/beta hydrolase n=1 Tax=Lysobacter sp. TAF61 TaxID=3233072 RepID=UPI003F9D03EA
MATAPDDDDQAPRRGFPFVSGLFAFTGRMLRKSIVAVALLLLVVFGVRACLSTQGPSLQPWHTIVPDEPSAQAIATGTWQDYVAAEQRMFGQLRRKLDSEMKPGDRTPLDRYYARSLTSPEAFGHDWNRSYVLEPAGTARGVVVLVHGLTDSPYSMLSMAELYRRHGFIAIAPRMPGHGTVPAGLTREGRKEWHATVEMTMAEARRRAGGRLPIHLVGYSNGAALALHYVMTRIERGEPGGVARIVLMSPMIEVNRFARFAGIAGWPALFPRYAKSAWLDLLPEFNAFKYNSFPVRAARESYLVTDELKVAMDEVAAQKHMDQVPPILAFQSVVDDTVGAQAVMTRLFDRLASNGSELVLFDVNRNRVVAPVLRTTATEWVRDALQKPSRRYALTVVGAESDEDSTVVARTRPVGSAVVQEQQTGLRYPGDVYSLSHIGLPFAQDDALYGNVPSGRRIVQLGALAVRGERNVLVVSQDSLSRLSFNPFHGYMLGRVVETIPSR